MYSGLLKKIDIEHTL